MAVFTNSNPCSNQTSKLLFWEPIRFWKGNNLRRIKNDTEIFDVVSNQCRKVGSKRFSIV